MSFDVAWSPDCIDGRCYDAEALSKVVDFLVVMAYDEQSQIKTADCVAKANSPLKQTEAGKARELFSVQFLANHNSNLPINLVDSHSNMSKCKTRNGEMAKWYLR